MLSWKGSSCHKNGEAVNIIDSSTEVSSYLNITTKHIDAIFPPGMFHDDQEGSWLQMQQDNL